MPTALRSVTLGVPDLPRAQRLFGDRMGLARLWEGEIAADHLQAWGLKGASGVAAAIYAAGNYAYGRLRLIAVPADRPFVRRDFGDGAPDGPLDIGPKAIDFYVRDPIADAMRTVEADGWTFRSRPRRHQIGAAISEETLFTGPGETPILLMVGHRHAPTSLRQGSPEGQFSEIATVSVISRDLKASRRFYQDALGLVAVNDAETDDANRDLVCDLVDAPRGTRVHFLLMAERGEPSGKVLLVQFHDVARASLTGRMRPGHQGFSLMSVGAPDLDGTARAVTACGGRILTPPTEVGLPEGRRRILMIEGPNDEAFEIVEGE